MPAESVDFQHFAVTDFFVLERCTRQANDGDVGQGRPIDSEPQQLIQSGLLTTLTQTIVDFSHSVLEHPPTQMNPSLDSVTVALDFLTLLCEEWGCGTTRDILASNLDPHLLKLLLKTLCSYTDCSLLSEVEDAAVAFFRQFCWAHPDNSRRFAQILLDVLQPIGKYLVPVVVNFLIETFFMFQE